jgi:hypothetical protein
LKDTLKEIPELGHVLIHVEPDKCYFLEMIKDRALFLNGTWSLCIQKFFILVHPKFQSKTTPSPLNPF